VFETTILCITIRLVYDALLDLLGSEGFLFIYIDDVYMGGVSIHVPLALSAALGIYDMVGLQLEWGPKKKKVVLPPNCNPERLPLPRDPSGKPLPEVVLDFKACLGVPRHLTSEETFILGALEPVSRRNDSLLDLDANGSDEDPFAALRFLHVCGGVNMFGHILSEVPPESSTTLCAQRDATITKTFGVIQGLPVDSENTTHDLPAMAGGAGLPFMYRTTFANYMGTFF